MECWRLGINVIVVDTRYKLIVGSNSMNIHIKYLLWIDSHLEMFLIKKWMNILYYFNKYII